MYIHYPRYFTSNLVLVQPILQNIESMRCNSICLLLSFNIKILVKTTVITVSLAQKCIYLKIHIYNSCIIQKLKYAVMNVA